MTFWSKWFNRLGQFLPSKMEPAGKSAASDPPTLDDLLTVRWNENNAAPLEALLRTHYTSDIDLPEDTLRKLEARLRPQLNDSAKTIYKFRFARSRGYLLRAYEFVLFFMARRKLDGTRELILTSRQQCPALADGAAEALAILEGIHEPADYLAMLVQQVGFDGLSENQKGWYKAHELRWTSADYLLPIDLDVGEIGDDQDIAEVYREKQAAFHAYTLKGLHAIGAHETARLLELALQGTGSLEALDECLRDGEDVLALLFDFARAHPDEFRPSSENDRTPAPPAI